MTEATAGAGAPAPAVPELHALCRELAATAEELADAARYGRAAPPPVPAAGLRARGLVLRERAGRLAAAAAALDPAGPGAAELRDRVERLAERCATASESLLGAAPRSSPRSGRE